MMPKTTKYLNNYKDFYEAYPHKDNVSPQEFRLILKMFFNLLKHSMIHEGKIYKFPSGVGIVGIFNVNAKKQMFDYQLYKSTGVKRNLRNLHSEEKCFGIKWITTPQVGQPYKFEHTHSFKASRRFQRDLAKAIKNDNTSHLYQDNEVYIH